MNAEKEKDQSGQAAAGGGGEKQAEETPPQAAGEGSAAEESTGEKPAPEKSTPEESTPEESTPEESAPKESAPKESNGEESAGEDPAGEEEEDDDPVAALEAKVAELNDKLLRTMAESVNVRRRAQREKEDASKYAIANFAREMLQVADNLHRALESVDGEARKTDEALENLCQGVEMTERSMLAAMERVGIKSIDALGARFDHNLHEAMFELEDAEKPAGTVIQVLRTGYKLQDRLLRPAQVGLAKGGAKSDDLASGGKASTASKTEPSDGAQAYDKAQGRAGTNLDEEL